jgi:putative CocE/NonD family hydrolase
MRDGIRLFATAWHPEGSSRSPVVIDYDPYRSSDWRTLGRGNWFRYLARHGYVVVHLNVRGTDASEGTVTDEYLPKEQEDGYDAIEWLAAQPWSNGNVGMMGTSYAGFTPLQVAMHRPPHLKAIIPLYATDDRYTDDVHYTGGALHAICDLPTWATMMVCFNALPPHESVGADFARLWREHLEGNEPYQFNWLAHPTDGPYWRHASLRPHYERIQCAVFMVGGWQDGYRNCVLRTYQNLAAPKKALIGPWGHVFPEWGVPGPRINFMAQAVRWFDHWLKGIDTGVLDEPPVTVYMQEYDPPDRKRTLTSGQWRSERSWPPAGAKEEKLYLGPNGSLGAAPAAEGQDVFTYKATVGTANRTWSSVPWTGCAGDQRPDEHHSLVYTTEALRSPLEILGAPRVRIVFASTALVATVVCKLSDVAPDGASALIGWGTLNATHRKSHSAPEPLKPGERYALDFELDATGWIFRPGHRIRLAVSGSDWPNLWPSPYPARNTVWRGGDHGSCLILPAVPAGKASDGPNLGEPVMPLDRYVLRCSPLDVRVTRDLMTERATFEMAADEVGDLPEENVRFSYHWRSSFTASDAEPARAALSTEHEVEIVRNGVPTVASTRGRMDSTVDAFQLAFDLCVTHAGAERFTKHWMKSFPRNGV